MFLVVNGRAARVVLTPLNPPGTTSGMPSYGSNDGYGRQFIGQRSSIGLSEARKKEGSAMASILGAPSPRRGRSQHAGTAMATIMSAPSPRRELPVAEVEQRRLSWAARNPRCGSSSRIEAALTDGTSSGQQHKLRLSRSPAAPSPAASPHSPAAGQRKPPTFNEAGGAAATFAVPSYPAPPAVQSPYDGAREHAARAARNADEARAVRERELQVARAQLEAAETRAAEAAAAAAAQRQRLAHAAQAEQAAHDFGGTGGGVRGFGGGGGGSGGGGGGVSRACAAALGGEFGGGAAPCRAVPAAGYSRAAAAAPGASAAAARRAAELAEVRREAAAAAAAAEGAPPPETNQHAGTAMAQLFGAPSPAAAREGSMASRIAAKRLEAARARNGGVAIAAGYDASGGREGHDFRGGRAAPRRSSLETADWNYAHGAARRQQGNVPAASMRLAAAAGGESRLIPSAMVDNIVLG